MQPMHRTRMHGSHGRSARRTKSSMSEASRRAADQKYLNIFFTKIYIIFISFLGERNMLQNIHLPCFLYTNIFGYSFVLLILDTNICEYSFVLRPIQMSHSASYQPLQSYWLNFALFSAVTFVTGSCENSIQTGSMSRQRQQVWCLDWS